MIKHDKLSVFLLLVFVTTSGCEMTLFPRSEQSNPADVKPVKIEAVEGRTPLELVQAGHKNVQTIFYPDWGYYVSEIDQIKNEISLGPEGRYWVLYVNGQQVKEGTDRVRLKGDESVEFRFEKPK